MPVTVLPVKPTVVRSIFTRIVFHGSTAKKEANAHRLSEAEVYNILRTQIVERLGEAQELGYTKGRNSAVALRRAA